MPAVAGMTAEFDASHVENTPAALAAPLAGNSQVLLALFLICSLRCALNNAHPCSTEGVNR